MGLSLNEKYYWFIRYIGSHRNITLRELNEAWIDSGINDMRKPVSRRTFINMRNDINRVLGIDIKCRRNGKDSCYFIDASPGSGKISEWLNRTVQTRNVLMQSLSIKDRIVLEDVPSADIWLEDILTAIKENRCISFTYKDYWEEPAEVTIKPYFIKLFHQRWHVIGPRPDDDNSVRSYALDENRMSNCRTLETRFTYPPDFDPEDFYYDNSGTLKDSGMPVETIRILVWEKQNKYLESVPLHHSQKTIHKSETDGYSIFEYRLQPTYDLEMALRSYGNDVEVLSPKSLRERMISGAEDVLKEYRGESRSSCKEEVPCTEDI